jgi:hypothetical protein
MRTLRVLRVVMIARFLRVLRFFGLGSLQLMINCIIGTLGTLAWCLMLVAFLTFSFSIFFVQSFAFSLEAHQEDVTEEQFKEVMNRFGSVSKGMLTLSMAISGGMDWGDMWDILRLAGPLAHSFYLGFVFFSLIAMWNIITSIFVEKALQFAKPDADARILQVRKSQMESAKELKQLFAHIHFNDAHACTFQDFSDFLAVPEFWAGLEEKGINPEEAETFFLMLLKQNPTNDDRVDIDFLVESCLRIKGPASSMDLQMMRYELREMKRNQAAIVKLLHSAAHRRPQARQRTKPPGALRAADEPKTVQHTSAGSSYLGN